MPTARGMTDRERYDFDRLGYIIIKGFLDAKETVQLRDAVDALEEHAARNLPNGEPTVPLKQSPWGATYHYDHELGYHCQGARDEGRTIIIEDFFNADPRFDFLVDHPRTMAYVSEVVKERPSINNSEIRCRYRGNQSGSHGSGPHVSRKYQYKFEPDAGIDCGMCRMVYFVRDNSNAEGAFCVVPGSHKANLPLPEDYLVNVDDDPSMVGLEVKAGDAIFFTEHLRHGGFTNRTDTPRLTVHVGYGPWWFMCVSISTTFFSR